MARIISAISLCILVYTTSCSATKKDKEEAGTFTVTNPLRIDNRLMR